MIGLPIFAWLVASTDLIPHPRSGIEEPAELEMLRELGVCLGQGYILGRPKAVSRTTDDA